jgi:FkbM family methyltransferase
LTAATKVGPTGKIIAVEANPEVARLLRHSIGLNGFWHASVLEVAAHSATGEAKLNISDAESGGASIVRRRDDPFWQYDNRSVHTARLDSLIPSGMRIDVIKIDVEDGEFHAFQGMGALLDHPRAIFCEFMASGVAAFQDPLEYLQGFARRGFRLRVVEPVGTTPSLSPREVLERVGDRFEVLLFER